jgi:hypothetical protein
LIGAVRASLLYVACGACAGAVHCSKSTGAKDVDAGEAGLVAAPPGDEDAAGDVPMGERERAAWSDADGGDPAEVLRLVDLVGCAGLRGRASAPELRIVAVKAMRYCPDFSELPWLADLAQNGSDDVAMEALDTVIDQAARPRRAVDPEDADELHAGCAALLSLARSADRPRPRRIGAVRALRMLADRGCVQRADIPTDVDAK